ncbi:MAG TPA: hypothetical protein HA282_02355 [Nanoarchaeota archaeon]|nr:hypothetical protein [Candidatus Pacearchaeota archaeon]HIH33685.1 hypothetical protein [Nanoarchaeota archaeon]HIH51472.1 hypothetical protein [Nanoarchaeota archaeon]HIH66035.1 hypothetical protein [Nanoarchaeota archaeon]
MAKEIVKGKVAKSKIARAQNANGGLWFEIKRQLVHVLLGLLVLISALKDRESTLWFLLVLILIGVLLSLLQLKFRFALVESLLRKFEREKYRKRFPFKGALFFLTGCLLVLKIFSFDIALASIAILTFSDSVSHVIGLYGKRKNPLNTTKNIEGAFAGFVAGTIAGAFFVPFALALFASLASMFAEALSFKLQEEDVDDNVIIPLVAGTVIFLLQKFF